MKTKHKVPFLLPILGIFLSIFLIAGGFFLSQTSMMAYGETSMGSSLAESDLSEAEDLPQAESSLEESPTEPSSQNPIQDLAASSSSSVSVPSVSSSLASSNPSSVPSSSSQASSLPQVTPPSPEVSDDFKVVAYYPSWKPNSLDKVQYDVVTHIIYAFAIPTKDGGLLPLENPQTAQSLIASAHEHGDQVLLGVGGWSYQGEMLRSVFEAATATDEKMMQFADAILAMCDAYGFDGVDMDWEYPTLSSGSYKQYEKLMVYLGEKLHGKGKILTTAVSCGVTPEGTVYRDVAEAQTDKVLAAVDWINIMAYDGGDGPLHSTYDLAVSSAEYWKETRGLPDEKVVLGVPFYGRNGGVSYATILANDPNADQKDSTWVNGKEVHYNGVQTIQDKTFYAKKHLGGVMIWEVTQDTSNREKSLLTAIGQALAE